MSACIDRAHSLLQVLMATNRIDILDAALLRPGRIDRKIEFPNPNEGSRFDILKIHSRKMNLMRGIDLKKVADKMPVRHCFSAVSALKITALLDVCLCQYSLVRMHLAAQCSLAVMFWSCIAASTPVCCTINSAHCTTV